MPPATKPARIFDDKPAVRERTPLLIGLIGPSGTGKTMSALRLASGIQRVVGGETFVIDSEARRALHYADKFKFRHVPFGAPFSPLDYLAAVEHCVQKGAKTIIVDSMSHEHEGPGGVLEMHAEETRRIAALWRCNEEKAKLAAWQKPKTDRRRLINTLLQIDCNFIFCFRAKPKLKMIPGKDPQQMGYMPIAGDEFVYEMVLKCLLLPGANGVPVMESQNEGERGMIKVPEQFRALLREPRQLSEDIGQELATWAAGTAAPALVSVDELKRSYAACADAATWRALEDQRRVAWAKVSKDDKVSLQRAATVAKERIDRQPEQDSTHEGETGEVTSDGEPPPDVRLAGQDDFEPGSNG